MQKWLLLNYSFVPEINIQKNCLIWNEVSEANLNKNKKNTKQEAIFA